MAWGGAVWAMLTPLLVFAPIFGLASSGPSDVERANAFDAGRAGELLAVLTPVALLGCLGLVGTLLLRKGASQGRWFMGIAAGLLVLASLLGAASIGFFLFPGAFLLLCPTFWLPRGHRAGNT